jgi:hypothetical protein
VNFKEIENMVDTLKQCNYCGKKISNIEFELGKGYCEKCRKIIEWKKTLSDLKDFEK